MSRFSFSHLQFIVDPQQLFEGIVVDHRGTLLYFLRVAKQAPFGELDLGDQLRLEPHAVFHLLGQSPLGSLPLRQIGKRASADLQPLNLLATSRRSRGTKPFFTLAA
jgi:hypothetical protein